MWRAVPPAPPFPSPLGNAGAAQPAHRAELLAGRRRIPGAAAQVRPLLPARLQEGHRENACLWRCFGMTGVAKSTSLLWQLPVAAGHPLLTKMRAPPTFTNHACHNPRFPSLVNCTTFDWLTAWPRDALHSVATDSLAGV